MPFALIESGVVAQLFTPPVGFSMDECFHDRLDWIDCTATPAVAPGWTYGGGTFAAPAPPVAAPPPPPLPMVAPYVYFKRFTAAETDAIHTAALASPPTPQSLQLFNFLLLAASLSEVNLLDPITVNGHQMLVSVGLLTAARSATILTP